MAQCTAKSSTTGKPCGAPAIKGGTVCRMHGGSAPQVRNKAEARLALQRALDPAIRQLFVLLNKRTVTDETMRRTIMDVLDRNGLAPVQKFVELSDNRLSPEERKERLKALHDKLFPTSAIQ